MATELGKAYVQIVPSAKGIKGSVSGVLDGEASSAGKSAGSLIGLGIKVGIASAVASGTAALGWLVKNAIPAGAALQQSFGGLDTIYNGAEASAKQFAKDAAKAGISANNWAEQAVSMGAALKQSLGGDSVKAVEAANLAIMDMADNAAKMGTPIESLQMAYQGFAKQNYTMLDNLKLGYGGTKTEMERLLADAEKLTGVHYDINNLADVNAAIHTIQQSLGLTGVAAEEAKSTFSGSLGAMKASWENTLAGLSLGENIRPQLEELASTTSAFLFDNFFPMVGNVFKGLPDAIGIFISEASPQVTSAFQELFTDIGLSVDLSPITSKLTEFITHLQPIQEGFRNAFGQLPGFLAQVGAAFGPVITTIVDGLARLDFSGFQSLVESILPAVQAGFQTFMGIVKPAIDSVVESFIGMWNSAQPLISILSEALMPIFQIVGSYLGGVFKGVLSGVGFAFDALKLAIEFLTPVVDFLVQALNFVQPVLSVIAEWVGVAIGMFGSMGTAGEGLSAFTKSAWTNIQSAIKTAKDFIVTAIDWIKLAFSGAGNAVGVLKNGFSLAWMAIQDVVKLARNVIDGAISGIKGSFTGFQNVVSSVGSSVRGVINRVSSTIKGLANIDISGAGAAIMEGFLGGLKSVWGKITDFVGGIASWIAQHKGPISYDRVLLKPAGLAIMEGLNTNLKVGFKDVMGTVSGMAGAIAKPFEGQSLAYDMTASSSVDVRRNLMTSVGDLVGTDSSSVSLIAWLAKIEALLARLVDKEVEIYLDGEKVALSSYRRQGDILAREGL